MQGQANNFPGNGPANQDTDTNRRILLLSGLSMAVAFLLSSFYPPQLVLAVFSGLAMMMALGTIFTAVIMLHRPFRGPLNLWDKAALLALASVGAGLFVDPESVRAFVDANIAANAVAPAAPTPPHPPVGPGA